MTDREQVAKRILICKCEQGFYPIEALPNKSLAEQAKANGEINDHILSIEDIDRNVLWQRWPKIVESK